MVEGVHHVEIAEAVQAHASRGAQLRLSGRQQFRPLAGHSRSHDGAYAAVGRNLADAVRPGFGDDQVAKLVHGDTHGRHEGSGRRHRGLPARQCHARAGSRRNHARGSDLAHAVGAGVGDIEVAGAIQSHGCGQVQLGCDGGATVADGVQVVVPRDGVDRARGVDFAHAVLIGDIEVSVEVRGQIARLGQLGGGSWSAVAGKARGGGAGGVDPGIHGGVLMHQRGGVGHEDVACQVHRHRNGGEQSKGAGAVQYSRDLPAGQDFADALVLRIGDIKVALAIYGQASREGELGHGCGIAVAAIACDAGSRRGGDPAIGRHLAHAIAPEFGDVQVAGGVHCHVARFQHLRAGGGAAVAGGALTAAAGVGLDGAVGRDAAHAAVVQIGDVEVAGQIDGNAVGQVELGAGGRPAIAAETRDAGSRHGGDRAGGVDLADAVVVRIGKIQITPTVGGDALELMDRYRVDHVLLQDPSPLAYLLQHTPGWKVERREITDSFTFVLYSKVGAAEVPVAAARASGQH